MKAKDRKQILNEINRLHMLLEWTRKAYETSENLEIYLANCNLDWEKQSILTEELGYKVKDMETELIKLNNKLN